MNVERIMSEVYKKAYKERAKAKKDVSLEEDRELVKHLGGIPQQILLTADGISSDSDGAFNLLDNTEMPELKKKSVAFITGPFIRKFFYMVKSVLKRPFMLQEKYNKNMHETIIKLTDEVEELKKLMAEKEKNKF